jgi:hypothetical protein
MRTQEMAAAYSLSFCFAMIDLIFLRIWSRKGSMYDPTACLNLTYALSTIDFRDFLRAKDKMKTERTTKRNNL